MGLWPFLVHLIVFHAQCFVGLVSGQLLGTHLVGTVLDSVLGGQVSLIGRLWDYLEDILGLVLLRGCWLWAVLLIAHGRITAVLWVLVH